MKLDYTTVCQVNITMLEYTDEILYAFYKSDTTGVSNKSSATTVIIFKVKEDYDHHNFNQAVEFHHIEVKTLFATYWSMKDTFTVI